MFKKFSLLVLTVFLAINTFAQRANWEKMPISYLQLPIMPVLPMANKYQLEVVWDSDSNMANMIWQREQMKQGIIKANVALVEQGQMSLPFPVDNNYYPQKRDMTVLRAALQLNGCQQVTSSPQFKVKVFISGFYPINQEAQCGNVGPVGHEVPRCWYNISYQFKMSYQVLDGNGNIVRESLIYGTEMPEVKKSPLFVNGEEAYMWWSIPANRNEFYITCDNESYQNVMSRAAKQLNSELGFTIMNEKLEVANFNGQEYSDLQAAIGNAGIGYNTLITDKIKALDYINQANQGWEGALSEYNDKDKGRITEHTAIGLYVNLALGYCYTENWDRSNFYIAKLKSTVKEEYKKKIAETIAIQMDYQQRFNANIVH